jgi:hypothetical protein
VSEQSAGVNILTYGRSNPKWKKLHSSSNIIRVKKSRMILWTGQVARLGELINPLGCRASEGTMILKRISHKQGVEVEGI